MNILPLDFETYWDKEHALKKMSPIEYVMSPKTQLISCSARTPSGVVECAFGADQIRQLLGDAGIEKSIVVGHNMSNFDALILAWRLKLKPRMYLCTLAMARPVYGKVCGLSLAALVTHLKLGVKDNAILLSTQGKRLEDFTQDELRQMAKYNADDTELCFKLFQHLFPFFSLDELWHLDCNIRMMVEAELELDTGLLETALSIERSNKHKNLLEVAKLVGGIHGDGWGNQQLIMEKTRAALQSAPKFSALLESLGVEVPMKRSKTDPRKFIPAIAKTDEAMEELLEDPDDRVAAAARARLSQKSTQLETRINSFLANYAALGTLPVPAHYCGADTTGRDSGFLYNMYNLPRINDKKPKTSDALRRSIRAPKGLLIGVADSSGIELRVNHTLWKVKRSMDLWGEKANADLYRSTAAAYYHVGIDDVQPTQRQFAKVLELSCGFGIGGPKLRQTARIQGGLILTPKEADDGVGGWRKMYLEISDRDTGGWAQCQEALADIEAGRERAIDPWGLCHTTKDAIVLPSGRLIRYPDLRREWQTQYTEVDGELVEKNRLSWMYAHGRHTAYLYGGKTDENIVQALARDIIFAQALEFWKLTGFRPKHKVYDELVYLFPENEAPQLLAALQALMRKPPAWWPELVLWSEGDVAESYGDAK